MTRERIKRFWKYWGPAVTIVLLLCSSAYSIGFFFTKGAAAAGGLITITVNYRD